MLGLRGRVVASHLLFLVILVGVAVIGAHGAHSAAAAGDDATSTAAATTRGLTIVVGVAALLVAASAWWQARSVTTPLRELRSLLDAGSAGAQARRAKGDPAEDLGAQITR